MKVSEAMIHARYRAASANLLRVAKEFAMNPETEISLLAEHDSFVRLPDPAVGALSFMGIPIIEDRDLPTDVVELRGRFATIRMRLPDTETAARTNPDFKMDFKTAKSVSGETL